MFKFKGMGGFTKDIKINPELLDKDSDENESEKQ